MNDEYADMKERFGDVGEHVALCGLVIGRGLQSDDVVFRWMCEQWHGLMCALPQFTPDQARQVLITLGKIALTMQRIGVPEYPAFQAAAAGMIRAFESIIGPIQNEVPESVSSIASTEGASKTVH